MVSKNQQNIVKANGMHNLSIVPTQVTFRGNEGSLDPPPMASQLFTFGPREKCNTLRGLQMVSKNQQKVVGRQWYAQSTH